MKFEVELAEKADRDLRNIFFYIAVDLSAPENAERQINRLRSEERRVGKECLRLCRSRWSPYH